MSNITVGSTSQPTVPPEVSKGAGRASARPAPRGRGLRRYLMVGAYIAPAVVLYAAFVLVPMAMAAYYGFFRWNGIGPLDDFVGLDNYTNALQDEVFRGAIAHNALLVLASLLVQGPLAIALALLLNRKMRGRSVLRVVFFAPYVLSEVITAVAWTLILQPDGALDEALGWVGLGGLSQEWLGDAGVVKYTLFVVITWKYIGFAIILFLAGLQGIPRELYEAAALDGATPWIATRRITLPLLGPTIRIWGFLTIIGSLQLFDLVWIMTGGGPADASTTMATYIIDRGFERSQFGYASAVAVVLFIISFAVALVYQRFVLRRDTEGALTRMAG